MANHFKVWDPNNNNVETTANFEDDTSQRGTGFQSNTAASSKYVNSGLRQANLFVAAFMQAVEDAGVNIDSLNFQSSVNNLKASVKDFVKPQMYRHSFEIKAYPKFETHNLFFYLDTYSSVPYINDDDTIEDQLLSIKNLLNDNKYYHFLSTDAGIVNYAERFAYGKNLVFTANDSSVNRFIPLSVYSSPPNTSSIDEFVYVRGYSPTKDTEGENTIQLSTEAISGVVTIRIYSITEKIIAL